MSTATHRITGIGEYANSFKMCAIHMQQYTAPLACDLWKIEALSPDDIAKARYPSVEVSDETS
jgi:hypothetical protein